MRIFAAWPRASRGTPSAASAVPVAAPASTMRRRRSTAPASLASGAKRRCFEGAWVIVAPVERRDESRSGRARRGGAHAGEVGAPAAMRADVGGAGQRVRFAEEAVHVPAVGEL